MYNCALSAAVEEPSIVDQVLASMVESQISWNSTTFNTVMSAYARDESRWAEAISTFNSMPENVRDSSSLSVVFSLCGKRSLWAEATGAFAISKSSKLKLTPVHYSLIVQATHRNSWQTSLRAFTDLRKAVGPDDIKEILVSRVVTSLEVAGRTQDAAKVLSSMKSKKIK